MASNFEMKMGEVFDVVPLTDENGEETYHEVEHKNVPATLDSVEDKDFVEARENLRQLAKDTNTAMQEAMRLARSSEHPRAWEVVAGLAKQAADINSQWVDLHEKRAKLKTAKKSGSESAEGERKVTNNNAFFFGTTDELQDLLQKQIEGKK